MEQGDETAVPVCPTAAVRAPLRWPERVRAVQDTAGRTGFTLAAIAAAGAAWWGGRSWATPAFVLVAAAGTLVAVVDVRTHRLPDAVVLPTWAATVTLLGTVALATGDLKQLALTLTGSALAFGAYATLRLAYPPGLGFGDVKLAGLLGAPLAWLGWAELGLGLMLPFVLGGAWAMGLLLLGRARRDTAVPFGPFMVLGAVLACIDVTQIAW
jgi:leader peptidase (prepilin peptidase)/N-methyltransferase